MGGGGRDWHGGKEGGASMPSAGHRLCVTNLPKDLAQNALDYVFGTYGKVTNVHFPPGQTEERIQAFVEYSTAEDAETAVMSLDGKYEIRPGFGSISVKHASHTARSTPY